VSFVIAILLVISAGLLLDEYIRWHPELRERGCETPKSRNSQPEALEEYANAVEKCKNKDSGDDNCNCMINTLMKFDLIVSSAVRYLHISPIMYSKLQLHPSFANSYLQAIGLINAVVYFAGAGLSLRQ